VALTGLDENIHYMTHNNIQQANFSK